MNGKRPVGRPLKDPARAERRAKEKEREEAASVRRAFAQPLPTDAPESAGAQLKTQQQLAEELQAGKEVQAIFDAIADARDPVAAARRAQADARGPGERWRLPDHLVPVIGEPAAATRRKYLTVASAGQYPEIILLLLLARHILVNLFAELAPYVVGYIAARRERARTPESPQPAEPGSAPIVTPAPSPGIEHRDSRPERIGEIDAIAVDIGAPLAVPDR